MRVTNGIMSNSYLKDIQNNLQKIDRLNTQLNSNKQVNKISDDPYKAIKIMNLQGEINDVEKYNENCDEIVGWLDATDEALDTIGNLTTDIRTLLLSVDDTKGESEIKAVQSEINEKIKQIGEALNTKYLGKHIFGGTDTDTPPINIKEDENGLVSLEFTNNPPNSDKLKVEISQGMSLDYNITIDKVGNQSGLDALNNIVKNIADPDFDISKKNDLIDGLDNYINDVRNSRTIVGAKTNTAEAIKTRNEDNIIQVQDIYSKIQDVDIAEKYIELSSAQMVYQASMQVGSKLIQPTILDYLR